MENFFGIMKSEFLYFKEFKSVEHFKIELEKYIPYYNTKRIKAKLKGMSPIQYRAHAQTDAWTYPCQVDSFKKTKQPSDVDILLV